MRLKAASGIVLTVLLIGMLTSAFTIVRAQPPATEWTRTYGGDDLDQARSVVETSDGGYALAGWTESFGARSGDFWLIKLAPPSPPVGGFWVPVDKLGLLAPYISVASTILVATAVAAIYVKRTKCLEKKQ